MDRMQRSIDQINSDFLTAMIDGGIVNTPFKPLDERIEYTKYFEWFLALAPRKQIWTDPNQFHLSTAAQSLRWQVSHFPAQTHPSFATNYWAVELAHFAVPDGQIGFVKTIEQVVNDVDGNYYPTNVSFWGSPQFVDPDVDNLRWYLTLSEYYGWYPPQFALSTVAPIPVHALPGHPYPDLPEIDGIWYPAHAQRPLNLLVPGRHVLRLFMISPPTVNFQWQVSGRLSGYTQSSYNDCAVRNARDL